MEKSKKIKFIILPLIFLLIFALSLIFDSQILSAVQSVRTPVFDAFFSIFLFIENDFIFYPLIVVATIIVLLATKRKEKLLPYIISAAAVVLLTLLLKWRVARPRPDMAQSDSFPSSHTSSVFASLPFFNAKATKITWLVIACLFAFTRVWFNLHYLSDIIFGAALGFYISLLINFCFRKFKK